jgi:transcriptional regulator with XRE-family HTH domain
VAAFLPAMLAEDRKRAGWTIEQAARRLGVSQAIYRELEAGDAVASVGDVGPDLPYVRLAADIRGEPVVAEGRSE